MNYRNHSNDGLLIAVVAVILLLVIGGGVFFFFSRQQTSLMHARALEQRALAEAMHAEAAQQALQQQLEKQNAKETKAEDGLNNQTESQTISFLTWNVDSEDNDPNVIAFQLAALGSFDLMALSNVDPLNASQYCRVIENTEFVLSQTGASRNLLVWNPAKLRLLSYAELSSIQGVQWEQESNRSQPFLAVFEEQDSRQKFQIIAVEMSRTDNELRSKQADAFSVWGKTHSLPTFAIGQFHARFEIPKQTGDSLYESLLQKKCWIWAKPADLLDTTWIDSDGDGVDNTPDTLQEFTFFNESANSWDPTSRIVVREDDFPDDDAKSAHRPLELMLTIPASVRNASHE